MNNKIKYSKEDLAKGGIYRISFLCTKRTYIGSAVNFKRRWYSHQNLFEFNKHNQKLSTLKKKYGLQKEDMIFEILEIVEDHNTLLEREQYYLDTLYKAQEYVNKTSNTFDRLSLNGHPIAGFRPLGMRHSEEVKRKISEARKGTVLSEETRRRQRLAARKRNEDPEYGRKISAANRGRKHSERAKEKNRLSHTGLLNSRSKPVAQFKVPEISLIQVYASTGIAKSIVGSNVESFSRPGDRTYSVNKQTGGWNFITREQYDCLQSGCQETKKIVEDEYRKRYEFEQERKRVRREEGYEQKRQNKAKNGK